MKKITDLMASVGEAKDRWQKAVERFDAGRRQASSRVQEIVRKAESVVAERSCHEVVDAPQHVV